MLLLDSEDEEKVLRLQSHAHMVESSCSSIFSISLVSDENISAYTKTGVFTDPGTFSQSRCPFLLEALSSMILKTYLKEFLSLPHEDKVFLWRPIDGPTISHWCTQFFFIFFLSCWYIHETSVQLAWLAIGWNSRFELAFAAEDKFVYERRHLLEPDWVVHTVPWIPD